MLSRLTFCETLQRSTISPLLNARRAKTPRPLMFDDPITMSLFMCWPSGGELALARRGSDRLELAERAVVQYALFRTPYW